MEIINSIYALGHRFDAYSTDGDFIIFDSLRYCYKDRVKRVIIHRSSIKYIECGKHLNVTVLLIALALMLTGIVMQNEKTILLILCGLALIIYVAITYHAAGLIIHTHYGDFMSGICVKEDEGIFNWYMNKTDDIQSELLEIIS